MARKLVVEIVGDSRSLEKAFTRSSRASKNFGRDVSRAARGGVVATVGFRGLGRSVAFASASFLGGAGFVAGARKALDAASDLGEEINKTKVLFGQNAAEIQEWSRTTATAIGLSQRAALQAAGNFAAMFETLRLGDAVSSRMSRQLVQLGADLASFSNQDPEDMLDRLRSGLAGEAEPLRRFGILLSEARVQQEAYASGLAKSGAKLTEQQKVQARFNLILKDSAAAQGDFARTSQSQANQERINAALREQAAQRIGQVLLPAYNKATRAVNKWLGDERNLAKLQRGTAQALDIATSAAKAFADVAQAVAPIVAKLNRAFGGTANTVKLLLAVFVASKVVAFSRSLALLGTTATVTRTKLMATTGTITTAGTASTIASGRVNALRGALLRLGAVAAITIGIEIVMHKEQINRTVTDFVRRNRNLLRILVPIVGFAPTGAQFSPGENLPELERTRAAIAKVRGENDLMVRALDVTIKRLRTLDSQNLHKAEGSFEKLRKKIAAVPDKKKVNVESTLKGIDKVQGQLAKVKDKTVEVKVLERGLDDMSTRLGLIKDKTVAVAFIETGLAAIQAELDRLSGRTIEVSVTATEKSARASVKAGFLASAGDAADTAANKAAKLGNTIIDRITRQSTAQRSLNQQLANSEKRAAHLRDLIREDPANVKLQERLSDELRLQVDLGEQIADAAEDVAQNAKDQAAAARDHTLALLDTREAQAGLSKSLQDDLKVAKDRESTLRRMQALNRGDLDIAQQLVSATQRRRDLEQQIAQNQADARKRGQFRALGLTAEGQQRVPSVQALTKRLGTLRNQVKGTILDTPKTQTQLDRIGKVLSGKFGKLGKDVRAAIQGMFQDIFGALGDGGDSQLTAAKKLNIKGILANVGLSEEEQRELRSRLSQVSAVPTKGVRRAAPSSTTVGAGVGAGAGALFVNVYIDGNKVEPIVTKRQQKKNRHTGGSRAGTNPGGRR